MGVKIKTAKLIAMEEHDDDDDDGVCVCVRAMSYAHWMTCWVTSCMCVCPDLWCLLSWAALSSSWMFLVICSVLRMTSSVVGRPRSGPGSGGVSSSGMEEAASPGRPPPTLLRRPLRLRLLLPGGTGGSRTQ